jgi:hypothetical protein
MKRTTYEWDGIIIQDINAVDGGEGRAKDQQYSGSRDYLVGKPNKKGLSNQFYDDNNWSDEKKAAEGLTFKEQM